MFKDFGLFIGIICLSFCSHLLAAPTPEQHQSTLPLCTDEWKSLYITVDDYFEIYVEGTRYDHLYNANKWEVPSYIPLTWYPTVVAVHATDFGGMGGILGSSEVFLTDGSWKCTNEHFESWEQPSFDDSTWPSATEIGTNGIDPWGQIYSINANAKWIWTPKYIYGPDSDKEIYCRKKFCQRCPSTGPSCKTSCEGLADGPYQSCNGCSTFIICAHGVAEERYCAAADANGNRLKWSDDIKTCAFESKTCRDCDKTSVESTTPVPSTPSPTANASSTSSPCTGTGASCITSCDGLINGDYQSCKGCHIYATCSNGILHDGRECAPTEIGAPTYWDDVAKMCVYLSRTCSECPKK